MFKNIEYTVENTRTNWRRKLTFWSRDLKMQEDAQIVLDTGEIQLYLNFHEFPVIVKGPPKKVEPK